MPAIRFLLVLLAVLGSTWAVAGKIYWSQANCSEVCFSEIHRANLDGSGVEPLTDTRVTSIRGLALDPLGDRVYWSENLGTGASGILGGDDDGCLLVTAGFFFKLEVDAPDGKIYSLDFPVDSQSIRRRNPDGSGQEAVYTVQPGDELVSFTIGASDDMLFVVEVTPSSEGRIRRIDLDTNEMLTVHLGPLVTDVAVDEAAGKIYWTEEFESRIRRANLDGSAVEDVLSTPLLSSSDLALDPTHGKIYWTRGFDLQIWRANLDGSGEEPVVTETAGVTQLAVDPDDELQVSDLLCDFPSVPAVGPAAAVGLCLLMAAGFGLLYRRRIER